MSNDSQERVQAAIVEWAPKVALPATVRHRLTPSVIEQLGVHYTHLLRWNQAHNLTRIVDAEDAALKHYLDCLAPSAAVLEGAPATVFDIGSGAGFPGLVLAAAWPEVRFVLIEPAQKRASFLQIVAAAMDCRNVQVVAEGLRPGSAPPAAVGLAASQRSRAVVTSRATFPSGGRQPLFDLARFVHAAAGDEAAGNGAVRTEVAVWGVPDEADAWATEAVSAGCALVQPVDYALAHVGRRSLLRAYV